MHEIQDTTGSDSNSSFEGETGVVDPLDGWDIDFEDVNKPGLKLDKAKQTQVIHFANKKVNLLNFLKTKIKISFETYPSPSGWDHKASCPFKDHSDSSPSFFCNSKSNIFKCHGCGRGGGPVQFISYYSNKSFISVAEEILSFYGNLETVYEEIQDKVDSQADEYILNFNSFIREVLARNINNDKLIKLAESLTWTLDIYIEKQIMQCKEINDDNISALISVLKNRLQSYEQNINSG